VIWLGLNVALCVHGTTPGDGVGAGLALAGGGAAPRQWEWHDRGGRGESGGRGRSGSRGGQGRIVLVGRVLVGGAFQRRIVVESTSSQRKLLAIRDRRGRLSAGLRSLVARGHFAD
jgi:hypothetical protein